MRRSHFRRRAGALLLPLATLAVLISAAELLIPRLTSPLLLAPPSHVFAVLTSQKALLWKALGVTSLSVLLAFIGAASLALTVASLAVFLPRSRTVSYPALLFLRTSPIVFLAPLIHHYAADTPTRTHWLLGALMAVFPMAAMPLERIRKVPKGWLEAPWVMGASRLQIKAHVECPWAFAGYLDGLHVGASLAVVGVLVAEMIYPVGIGKFLTNALYHQNPARALASLTMVTIASAGWTYLVGCIARVTKSRLLRIATG